MSRIEIRGLTKRFSGKTALDGLDLSLAGGQIVGLLGTNGSGKTTLLHILAGLHRAYEGDVRIDGLAPSIETCKRISFLPDESYMQRNDMLRHYINLYANVYSDFSVARVEALLQRFGVDPDVPVRHLSKGMQEKGMTALCLARKVPIYLMDEPLGGADPLAREEIFSLLTEPEYEGALFLISTHLVRDLEPFLDRAVILHAGRAVCEGEIDRLRARYGTDLVGTIGEVIR